MNRSKKLAAYAAVIMLACSNAVLAQDEPPSEEPEYQPVETFTCSYLDGKGRADLDRVIAQWNEWMDDHEIADYFAAVLTPYFFGEPTFDIGWLGVWGDGNGMGAGLELWNTKGGEMNAKFFEVLTCDSHTGWVSMNVRQPPQSDDESDTTFVLSFQNCSMAEGNEFEEFLAAQETWNAYSDEHGIDGGTWVWFPIWGEANDDYDFKYIYGEDDYQMVGANWQKFANGHWRKSEELFGDLLDCDIARVYHGEQVRSMEMVE